MRVGVAPQLNRAFAGSNVDHAHVAQHLPLVGGLLRLGRHLDVVVWERLQVRIHTFGFAQRLGDQIVDGDVGQLHLQAALAGQDGHLPRHVQAVEVIAGVGLSEALLARLHDAVREGGDLVGPGVEDVGEGAGKDTLDGFHSVAAAPQVLQRRQDGQPRAHGGLVKPVHVRVLLRLLHQRILLQRPRVELLVGRAHVDALTQPSLVHVAHNLRGAGVHNDRVRDVAVGEVVAKLLEVRLHRLRLERLLPRVQADAGLVEQHAAAAGDPHHADVDAEVAVQLLLLLLDLLQEGSADEARPHDAHRQRDVAEVKARVHRLERARHIVLPDHDGDVVLTAALRNAPDVDVVGGES
mmetsp:Transcript_40951/g.73586  ORF Transcript_40951/g.73586 Transcript_40951/m.73586 type:complete len:352 (+) Transcript_40951:324-1379(+)